MKGLPGVTLPPSDPLRDRPEARLEREILRATGREFPGLLVCKNEVGLGFRGALKGDLCPACAEASKRHRIAYGLGVGSPDLVAVPGGAFLGVELKTEAGRLSEDQERWHAAARAKGVDVIVVRSVEQWLDEVRRRI